MKDPTKEMIDITMKGARTFSELEIGLEGMRDQAAVVANDVATAGGLQMTNHLNAKRIENQVRQAQGLISEALKLIYDAHDKCTDFCTECGTEQLLPQTRSGGR
jgi:hypothetical protein